MIECTYMYTEHEEDKDEYVYSSSLHYQVSSFLQIIYLSLFEDVLIWSLIIFID